MLNINDFKYTLPQERIALYPLPNRDEAKLLIYQQGQIIHRHFNAIAEFLPHNTFLFFNNTKVIPARLLFQKETGAEIEIFLLSPWEPSPILAETMLATEHCIWKCTIGNLKRWPEGKGLFKVIKNETLQAYLINRDEGMVQFKWTGKESFAEMLNLSGETPLPPYLKRKPEKEDRERYQTIYSSHNGAVAAPTAGLHFTKNVFESLAKKNISCDFLTLHVSAGTFQPVKTENADDHTMHSEQIVISKKNLENLLLGERVTIPVGTTSMRTLESLYWFGVKLLDDKNHEFKIDQNDPYLPYEKLPSSEEALKKVRDYMAANEIDPLIGETAIFIKPGYTFRICKGLITNFHQPASTLILLIAAFIGEDWRRIYTEAMDNNYRFLSYGDSSLLLP